MIERQLKKPEGRIASRSIMGNESNNLPRMLLKHEISAKMEKIPLFVPLTCKGQGAVKVRKQQKT